MPLRRGFYTAVLLLIAFISSFGQEEMKPYYDGLQLIDQKKYQKAVDLFSNEIAKIDKLKSAYHCGRAKAHYTLGWVDTAKIDLEQGLETEANNEAHINSDLYLLKAKIALSEGEIDSGFQWYRAAVDYVPYDIGLKNNLAYELIHYDRPQEALEIYNALIQKGEAYPPTYNNRALAFIKLGDLDQAKADLEQSKKMDERNPYLYQHYFLYYQAKEEWEKACAAIDQALSLDLDPNWMEDLIRDLKDKKAEFCD